MITVRKIIPLLLYSLITLHSTYLYAENNDATIEKEVNTIIQIAIDLPDLQQYFHIKKSPLTIKLPAELNSIDLLRVRKFDNPVRLTASSSADIEIYDWITTGTGVSFNMAYPAEGVVVTYKFRKQNGDWQITQARLIEK